MLALKDLQDDPHKLFSNTVANKDYEFKYLQLRAKAQQSASFFRLVLTFVFLN